MGGITTLREVRAFLSSVLLGKLSTNSISANFRAMHLRIIKDAQLRRIS